MRICLIITGIGSLRMEKISNLLKNLTKKQIMFGIVAIVAILVLIVVGIVISLPAEPKVNLDFDVDTNIPAQELRKIREKLFSVIGSNTENFDEKATYDGIVRNYEETLEDDSNEATFIVDFDGIKQSYEVMAIWPDPNDGTPDVMVSCPILNSKYPETKCKTEVNSSTDIAEFLPYTGKLSSGEEFTLTYKYDANGNMYLEVEVDSCDNKAVVDAAVVAAKEWIRQIYLEPSDYLIYAPTNVCSTGGVSSSTHTSAGTADTNDTNVNANLPYFVPNIYKVYPVVDENNNVVSIKAELSGCTDYQTNPQEEQVMEYLNSKNISYPVEFEYCVDF